MLCIDMRTTPRAHAFVASHLATDACIRCQSSCDGCRLTATQVRISARHGQRGGIACTGSPCVAQRCSCDRLPCMRRRAPMHHGCGKTTRCGAWAPVGSPRGLTHGGILVHRRARFAGRSVLLIMGCSNKLCTCRLIRFQVVEACIRRKMTGYECMRTWCGAHVNAKHVLARAVITAHVV